MGAETYAIRIYGANDLRLEKFELPDLREDEILLEVITDSICLSSLKAAKQGTRHKRVPENIEEEPTILGHEFSGVIMEVGEQYKDTWQPGQKCTIQPAINYERGPVGILSAPGYSYKYIGGDATMVIVPRDVLEMDCLLEYSGDAYYKASLAEPLSCVIGAVHAQYHLKVGNYTHHNGIVEGGNSAILGGAGPMGLAAISYLLNGPKKPGLLVVTDVDEDRLNRSRVCISEEYARAKGVRLVYSNPAKENLLEQLHHLTDGKMMHDVFVFAPVKSIIEQGQQTLGFEGTLNFFAGPADPKFSAEFNFYDVHYNYHKVVGTSGGNTADMKEALQLMSDGVIDPSFMISHVGGLDAGVETTLHLPDIPGSKKLLYTHISMPLTAIDDFEPLSQTEHPLKDLYAELASLVKQHHGLWNPEAEEYLIKNAPKLTL